MATPVLYIQLMIQQDKPGFWAVQINAAACPEHAPQLWEHTRDLLTGMAKDNVRLRIGQKE